MFWKPFRIPQKPWEGLRTPQNVKEPLTTKKMHRTIQNPWEHLRMIGMAHKTQEHQRTPQNTWNYFTTTQNPWKHLRMPPGNVTGCLQMFLNFSELKRIHENASDNVWKPQDTHSTSENPSEPSVTIQNHSERMRALWKASEHPKMEQLRAHENPSEYTRTPLERQRTPQNHQEPLWSAMGQRMPWNLPECFKSIQNN